MRKIKLLTIISLVTLLIYGFSIFLKAKPEPTNLHGNDFSVNTKLVEKENKELITFGKTEVDLVEMGFEYLFETSKLKLYLKRDIFNIAVVDKLNNYIWFGFYPDYLENNYSESNKALIESGVTINYYDSQSLNTATMSFTSKDGGGEVKYQILGKKLTAKINFTKLGISFDVVVSLEEDNLNVLIPVDSIVEIPYKTIAMKVAKEYKLQNIIAFPYFGANNYQINGYAFIPDGPGALIRYNNEPSNSAFIKRIYDRDLGIQSEKTLLTHLKEEKPLLMPIYGVNHGYHQAAFFAQLISGDGAAELHSYPYQYKNNLNTTFFNYLVRDIASLKLSGGSVNQISMINKDPYPFDLEIKYTFLQDDQASYVGMANVYKKDLEITNNEKLRFDLNLAMIGHDEKPYLFGKKKVILTTYNDALEILTNLANDEVSVNGNYLSWTKSGTFGNNPYKFKLASNLGGKRAFKNLLTKTADLENVNLSFELAPLLVARGSTFEKLTKKTTLEVFNYPIKAAYLEKGVLLDIDKVSERILKDRKKYDKYAITELNLKDVGNFAYSYRIGKSLIYREEMISKLEDELKDLNNYSLGLRAPASYTFPYLDRYYDYQLQANNYSYISESVPFLSILLSGSVNLYSPYLNYASNLDLLLLQMIEYNVRPSFVVTKEEGHELKYTNYEYLFSTEYNVWERTIKNSYHYLEEILKAVEKEQITNHAYVLNGVSEITYQTKVIYVNYTNEEVIYNSNKIPPLSALLVEVSL